MVKKKDKKIGIPSDNKEVKERFGHLIPFRFIEIPKEHRHRKNSPHSLKCFKKIWQRDKNGKVNKSLPKRRCKRHVVEGYLYCSKHGGKINLPVKANNENNMTVAKAYKKVYDADMGDLLESFLNDPQLLDLKPDLANMRTILNNYIKKLMERPQYGTIANFMSQVRDILIEEEKTEEWKYNRIIELVESQNSITSGKSIDRINRCIENIGRTVERIHKYETNDNFLLTPDGIKILLRAMVDLMETNIKEEDILMKIRDGLLTLSVETKGDVSKYDKEKVVDAEIIE